MPLEPLDAILRRPTRAPSHRTSANSQGGGNASAAGHHLDPLSSILAWQADPT
jgi:hypothetical protein